MMLKRVLIFILFAALAGIIAVNFKQILTFGQTHEIQQAAQKRINARNWEGAIEIYESGQKQYANNTDISLKLAWLYRKNQQNQKAESLYRKLLKDHPNHEGALLGLASLQQMNPKTLNNAIDTYRKALKHYPRNFYLLSQLGDLYKDASENPAEKRRPVKIWLYGQAKYYYQEALKLNPRQFQTQFNLGVVDQNRNDLQAAAKSYCQAVLLNPNSYEGRYNLGVVLTELNYLDEGYRQMARAVQIVTERNAMDAAQDLALKVQTVKNRVFNSEKTGLLSRPAPPFLNKDCLTQPPKVAENEPKNTVSQ